MSPRPATDIDTLRADLLTHAQAVIVRDGVDGLTMRALAVEAGTAVGLSYKAFSSREELLWELAWRSLTALAQQLDVWAARPGGELADRLMEFSDFHFTSSPRPWSNTSPKDPGARNSSAELSTKASPGRGRPS